MRTIRSLAGAVVALAIAAPTAAAHDLPDAEVFATNNTAVITDPADPRLRDRLKGFARDVEKIVDDAGAEPRGSELLDGVFFSSDLGTTTFERSRRFEVDDTDDDQLHAIADLVRARFGQQSVLTFDHLPAGADEADAIELEVPGVKAEDLREGLLTDQTAREELFGGSVTLDGRLLLVAELADAQLARDFAERIGGDLGRAVTHYGEREFVEGPAPVVAHRTLIVEGGTDDGTVTVRERWGRLEVDIGGERFEIGRKRFDRVRMDLGDGLDRLVVEGSAAGERFDASAAGGRVRLERGWGREPIELDGVDTLRLAALAGDDRVAVGDLGATDTFQVDVDLGAGDVDVDRATVDGSGDDDSISVSRFTGAVSVLGPVFVRFENAEPADRLTVDGRGGRDDLSASTDAMKLTLDGGAGGGTLRGGPGDDLLIGGDGFDDAFGGRGDDVARLGGHFDRFSWAPGDGSDQVDGGASRDSLFFSGENAAEAFALAARGHDVRLTRDLGGIVMDLEDLEEIDTLAGRGEDTFAVGDLSGTPVELVDVSLSPGLGSPAGDGQADRVTVAGTGGVDALRLAGRVVIGGTATLTGLPWTVNVSHTEGALDTLAIDTGAGDDTLDTSAFAPDTIGLEVD